MPEHYYAEHKPHKRKLRLLLKTTVVTALVLVLIAVGWFLVPLFEQQEPEPVTSDLQISSEVSPLTVFRSAYFQFQASDKWVEDAKASSDDFYMYRAYRGRLIEHDLQVYVNPTPAEMARLRASRVVAVNPTKDGLLNAKNGISDHCGESIEDQNKSPRTITFSGVTFTCLVDGVIFDVLAGEDGGEPLITLQRPDNGEAQYVLYYRDLRANPDGKEFEEIINTFQSR
ncbi:MAG: hypothetical protein U5K77_03130 [Candidatus Saccharibacteria bacterium]|nr:hypothetical protein [Candidatus Saccharibacteria bacterium]